MDIICNYMVNMVYAADRTRTLFQPSQVHFSWVFQVCCASALFFDPSKSCDELLRFVIFFCVWLPGSSIFFIWGFGSNFYIHLSVQRTETKVCAQLLYQHIDFWVKKWSDWKKWRVEVTGRSEERSIKSVFEVTGRSEERASRSSWRLLEEVKSVASSTCEKH